MESEINFEELTEDFNSENEIQNEKGSKEKDWTQLFLYLLGLVLICASSFLLYKNTQVKGRSDLVEIADIIIEKKVKFDNLEQHDKEAFNTYMKISEMMSKRSIVDNKYNDLAVARDIIDLRQISKGKIDSVISNELTSLADNIAENLVGSLIKNVEKIYQFQDFSYGMAVSFINNINPLSFILPIENKLSQTAYYGELLGDTLSLITGVAETIAGASVTLGFSGATILVSSTGVGATASPVTVAGVIAGVMMAGHGFSTIHNSVKNIYKKLEKSAVISKLKESRGILDSARKLGLQTRIGTKVYAKLHKPLQSLPNGLKVKRIREGTDSAKIAVIGRKMPAVVDDTAFHLRKSGTKVETFSDDKAWDQFKNYQLRYNRKKGLPDKTYLPHNEVVKTQLYKSNKAWAQKLKDEGYTVFDLGDPLNATYGSSGIPRSILEAELKGEGMSSFYSIEKKILFGEQ